jgi:hypothetical protein
MGFCDIHFTSMDWFWYFHYLILYSIMHLPSVYYLSEDGNMVGRNVEEVIVYTD